MNLYALLRIRSFYRSCLNFGYVYLLMMSFRKIMEGDLAHEIIPSTCLPDTENPQGILQDHIFVGQQSHLQKSYEHSPADQHCEPDRQAWSITPMQLHNTKPSKSNVNTSSQLLAWVYETSDSKLVFSERLEKNKWE